MIKEEIIIYKQNKVILNKNKFRMLHFWYD